METDKIFEKVTFTKVTTETNIIFDDEEPRVILIDIMQPKVVLIDIMQPIVKVENCTWLEEM